MALKGDVDGNGEIDIADAMQTKAASLGTLTLEGQYVYCAMAAGGTEIDIADAMQVKAASLGTLDLTW